MPEGTFPPDRDVARRAVAMLDLTDLSERATAPATEALCARARAASVAAVCVWPQWVSSARKALAGSGVAIATVVNFPAGADDVERVLDDTREALSDGAGEIDLVMPYRDFARGDRSATAQMIEAVRAVVDRGRRLKVILETGELSEPVLIHAASLAAIAAGADFIKTSTGKTAVSSTPEAVGIMLHAIRESGRPAGLKASGGLRTVADARVCLALADAVMGPGWAVPATFRFGASALLDALQAAAEQPGAERPA